MKLFISIFTSHLLFCIFIWDYYFIEFSLESIIRYIFSVKIIFPLFGILLFALNYYCFFSLIKKIIAYICFKINILIQTKIINIQNNLKNYKVAKKYYKLIIFIKKWFIPDLIELDKQYKNHINIVKNISEYISLIINIMLVVFLLKSLNSIIFLILIGLTFILVADILHKIILYNYVANNKKVREAIKFYNVLNGNKK